MLFDFSGGGNYGTLAFHINSTPNANKSFNS